MLKKIKNFGNNPVIEVLDPNVYLTFLQSLLVGG